jgi:phosphatidylserine/phosphatidylglycerophosphate/cardiolipin synthase-like enzyme
VSVGLSRVSDDDLTALVNMIDHGELRAPFTRAALSARGLGDLTETLHPYASLDARGFRAVIDVVLSERRNRHTPKLSLVWTGEDPRSSYCRHTKIYLPQLLSRARRHVLIAGYSFDHGASLFECLHAAMTEHGVSVQLFVDINQLLNRLQQVARRQKRDFGVLAKPLNACREPLARANATIAMFFELLWPYEGQRPQVFFDLRTVGEWSLVSLHAKCVIVDYRYSLITSANFTDRGQSRNFETGVEIEDESFALSLARQWQSLIDEKVVIEGK